MMDSDDMSSGDNRRGGEDKKSSRTKPPRGSGAPEGVWRERRVQGLGTVRLGPEGEGKTRLKREAPGDEPESGRKEEGPERRPKSTFDLRDVYPVPPFAGQVSPAKKAAKKKRATTDDDVTAKSKPAKRAAKKTPAKKTAAKKPAAKKAARKKSRAADAQPSMSYFDWAIRGPRSSYSALKAVAGIFAPPRRKRRASGGGGSGGNGNGSGRSGSGGRPSRKPMPVKAGKLGYWTAVCAAWGGIFLGMIIFYYAVTLPGTDELWDVDNSPGVTLVSEDGAVLANRGGFAGAAVPLADLPPHLVHAVLAIEDERFYSHLGIDPRGILRAAWVNFKTGSFTQGGSTITQQLAKNVFLEPDRTLGRKVQEVLLALWLEARFTKDEILTLYLNRVYFGGGAYGVEAAARRYFNKSARDVTLAEGAMLAGLLKAPSRYAPTRDLSLAQERAATVLANMVREKFISQEEGQHAFDHPATLNGYKGSGSVNYAVDWVLGVLPSFAGRPTSDTRVITTIDPYLQRKAEAVLEEALARDGEKLGVRQAAIVAMTPDGAVKAMVGGRSYRESQFNRAVQAKRQPGSAFKPIVYLAAIEGGLSPQSVRVDAPISVDGWSPENYGRKFEGMMPVHRALARSVNTVAVQISEEVGRDQVIRTARRLGLSSPMQPHPSLALGTFETNLLELTAAYASFANGGYGVIPHGIERVETGTGVLLYERRGDGPGRVISRRALGAMNFMLKEVMESGTGRKAALDGRPAGGKTGTSQDSRDAWFIGYTADIVVGVWVGNDDSTPMNRVTGGTLPAVMWHDFMVRTQKGVPVSALPGSFDGSDVGTASIASGNDGNRDENWPFSVSRDEQPDEARSFLDRIFGAAAQDEETAPDLRPGRKWR
ncbi:transglycosylase domain-containing protein [Tepidicaulis sp.]|uniref:transglycosylase domain-containing protein n=1 Tax=Tepidicaulis sp. TaxID=1920809 RepID=UPI003B592073